MENKVLRLVVLERTKYQKILSSKSFIKVQKLTCQRRQPWRREADLQNASFKSTWGWQHNSISGHGQL